MSKSEDNNTCFEVFKHYFSAKYSSIVRTPKNVFTNTPLLVSITILKRKIIIQHNWLL